MQTSEKKKSPARKRTSWIVSTALVLLLFLAGNALLTVILTPYRGSAYEMWQYFGDAEPQMIYTGSSQCLCDIDPETIDSALGTTSYNMGTNMQSFRSSYAAIRSAVREKGVRRVVLCVDDEIVELKRMDNFRADASFRRARNRTADPYTAVKETAEFLLDTPVLTHVGSINFFFPWTYDRVTNIGENLREKRDGQVYGTEGRRLVTGREPSEEVLQDVFRITREEAVEWSREASTISDFHISKDSRRELAQIAAFCRDNGVELIPITLPYPTVLNIYRIESYKETQRELTDLFAAYGFRYRNFNLAKPDYCDMEITDYKDTGHFNSAGAVRFSALFADYLAASEEERDKGFYTIEEF